MLSCDEVREGLVGLAAGETPSPEQREHLATCDACRAGYAECARDVERVRESLAELAPSPFLEDQVVDALRVPAASRPRRPWAYVGAAALAAAALFLVVILPRLQEEAPAPVELVQPTGDERPLGRASIRIPPSAREVGEARERNAHPHSGTACYYGGEGVYHLGVSRAGQGEAQVHAEIVPPPPDALHRWVYGDGARAGAREEAVASWPREGVVLLGSDLVAETGGVLGYAGLVTPRGHWQPTPGSAEGEITVGAPGPGAAEARVRVLVSTGYSGTLLLEEPLAIALGLHLFEIPGEVRFTSPEGGEIPVRARRARARVRIPELGFDDVVEVQIVPERPWMVKGQPAGRGVDFEGEAPAAVLSGIDLEIDAAGTLVLGDAVFRRAARGDARLWEFHPPEGTRRMVLSFPSPATEPGIIGTDVPLLGGLFRARPSAVVPRALDFAGAHRHVRWTVERMTLRGAWEPGAEVTIAKVWRGTTAIPSAEPVVRTHVRANGEIDFPRIAGEPCSTLRMLVTTKDGTSTFQEVVVAPELLGQPRVEVFMRADGYVQVDRGTATYVYAPPWEGRATKADPEAVDVLREALRRAVDLPGMRDENGVSRVEVRLRGTRDTPWPLVQWVMQVLAGPGIRVNRIAFLVADEAASVLPVALPVDAASGARTEERARSIVVTLRRKAEGERLAVEMIRPGEGSEVSWTTGGAIELRLQDAIVALQGEDLGLRGLIRVPSPSFVTHAEVLEVLAAFRAAGIHDVRFEGAPTGR